MVKLPDVIQYRSVGINSLNIPIPGRDDLVGIASQPPSVIAERMAVVGSYLSFLEYTLCVAEADHMSLKEVVDYGLTIGMAAMDPKATIKSKEAALLATDEELRSANARRVSEAALSEHIKGLRNAYRAQYDTLSRVLSSKQLEADVARS